MNLDRLLAQHDCGVTNMEPEVAVALIRVARAAKEYVECPVYGDMASLYRDLIAALAELEALEPTPTPPGAMK